MTYLHAPDLREVAQVSFATVDSKGVMRALPEDLTLDDLRDFGYLSCNESYSHAYHLVSPSSALKGG